MLILGTLAIVVAAAVYAYRRHERKQSARELAARRRWQGAQSVPSLDAMTIDRAKMRAMLGPNADDPHFCDPGYF